MSDPVIYGKPLVFKPGNHRYYWDGQPVPSVTTILGRLNKPALIQWAAGCAADHVLANFNADLWHRSTFNPGEEGHARACLEDVCNEARQAHAAIRDSAGDLGKLVHERAVRLQSTGVIDMVDIPPAKQAPVAKVLMGLDGWLAKQRMGAADLERKVFSRTYLYAGMTDRWGTINGHYAVLDFKTGNGVYDEAWYQMAGYELALREELGVTEPVWHYLLHLDKNTGECVPYVRGPEETKAAMFVWQTLVQLDKAIRAMPKMKKAA